MTYDGGKPFIDGTEFTANQVHTVTAVVDATTAKVVFTRDVTAVLKTDTAAPFDYGWTPTVLGDHLFAAKPINAAGTEGAELTVSFKVVPSPSPTPTPPTPTPSATPTPIATVTPSPSPSPTTRTVTVEIVNPTTGDAYQIYYGTAPNSYGPPVAILKGASSVDIQGLNAGTTYYFANKVTRAGVSSVMSNPVAYTVTTAKTQRIGVP